MKRKPHRTRSSVSEISTSEVKVSVSFMWSVGIKSHVLSLSFLLDSLPRLIVFLPPVHFLPFISPYELKRRRAAGVGHQLTGTPKKFFIRSDCWPPSFLQLHLSLCAGTAAALRSGMTSVLSQTNVHSTKSFELDTCCQEVASPDANVPKY